jgi:hypothetical protein
MPNFERVAGTASIAVGIGGLAYAIAFVTVLSSSTTAADAAAATFLLLGGLLSTAVVIGMYGRLRRVDEMFALWALVLGLVGAVGSAVHGGFDLALLIHPVEKVAIPASSIDPRGLLTFGVTALALAIVSWLTLTSGAFTRPLGYLAATAAALLAVIYISRLTVFDPKNPFLLVIALLTGFVVNPALYFRLGLEFLRGPSGRA